MEILHITVSVWRWSGDDRDIACQKLPRRTFRKRCHNRDDIFEVGDQFFDAYYCHVYFWKSCDEPGIALVGHDDDAACCGYGYVSAGYPHISIEKFIPEFLSGNLH